jgi:GNAT superfamily N-acetyltransferase
VSSYVIRKARVADLPLLPAIERAAAALFPDDVITPEIRAGVIPSAEMEAALADGRLWIAAEADGTPVGFAIAVLSGTEGFLREIDVHPQHQGRGLGRRLIQEVVGWARARGFLYLSLTTFEYVLWNAPFYARLGFQKLADGDLGPELRDLLQLEQQQGLRQRVAMRLTL